MVHAINHQPLLAENRFQHRADPCGVYGGHSDMGQVYLRMIGFSFWQNNYTLLHIFILLLSEGQSGATCEPANIAMRNFGNKSTSTFILFLKGLMNTPISFFSG